MSVPILDSNIGVHVNRLLNTMVRYFDLSMSLGVVCSEWRYLSFQWCVKGFPKLEILADFFHT